MFAVIFGLSVLKIAGILDVSWWIILSPIIVINVIVFLAGFLDIVNKR